ncbi:Retrovirus-related Pol polyprotein from transposon TNT 1-94 [Gossypium australe]|uniref:Retrovirus-related Pol polyprotein from transposon TNT 1-94 n=1 Tax=Gossypium australe TaxID=47621 RepID=A0A5B6VNS9_9ROSI|nr:Retrovirus-related Pol polyprotein from transposon TNT 1-94 [Gossypium australe]
MGYSDTMHHNLESAKTGMVHRLSSLPKMKWYLVLTKDVPIKGLSAQPEEVWTFEANVTRAMEALPPRKKGLGSKWVYKKKYNSNGSIKRLKDCLVVLDNHQIEGIYYNEAFSPVAKMVIVRTFLVNVVSKN